MEKTKIKELLRIKEDIILDVFFSFLFCKKIQK